MAAMELLRRRKARTDLLAFTEYTLPSYEPAPHHRIIARALDGCLTGETDRLAIFMPPRHGKSELASRRFPAYAMGRRPDLELMASSYSQDMADDFGRDVRDIVRSPEFGVLFPALELRQDSRAVNRWQTTGNGAYRAVGIGGPATGRGADILLIDDPVKDRADADSDAMRGRTLNWYKSTAYTRLSKNSVIILIQTRWHDMDLAGAMLEEMRAGGDQWKVVDLPAILPNGKPLWGERFDLQRLERIKRAVGPREWSALYMQKPQPDEGSYFKREWFRFWTAKPTAERPADALPKRLAVYGTSDYAVTADGGDFTVHRIWGICPEGNIYRLDGWRGQTAANEWVESKIDLMAKWKPFAWFGEQGVIQKAVEPMLRRRMMERKTFCRLEWVPSLTDKPTRARGFQARAAMRTVWLEPGADLSEFLTFPTGKHDDEVDVAGMIGRALDEAHPAIRAHAKPPTTRPDAWEPKAVDEDTDWKVQ